MRDVDSAVTKKKRGLTSFIWAVLRAVFWGLLIGLIINCFMWHEEGYKKLMLDMNNTYKQQINGIAVRNIDAASEYAAGIGVVGDTVSFGEKRTENLLDKVPYIHSVKTSDSFNKSASSIGNAINHFFEVLVNTFKVLAAKFLSVFASFWVFIFAAILGATDGLLARYVRTNEGGRESTFIFHRVSDTVIKIPVAIVFLYLTIPLFLNPELVVLVMSILFFMFFYIATANLKKFL